MTRWILLCLLCVPVPAMAMDYFVEGGVGLSAFQRTAPDGTWVQEGFPHHYDRRSLAYRAGLGVKLTPHWSVGVNYLSLGTVMIDTGFVADESYDPQAHRCHKQCETVNTVRTADTFQGGELIGTYRPWLWPVSPFVRFGVAGLQHDLTWQVTGLPSQSLTGMVIAGVVGGGLCYQEWACVDVSYYKGLGSTKFPVSTDVLVPMASVRVGF